MSRSITQALIAAGRSLAPDRPPPPPRPLPPSPRQAHVGLLSRTVSFVDHQLQNIPEQILTGAAGDVG